MHAPYGTGVLAGRSDWLDAAQPYLAGGGATAAVTEHGTRWATGAARHEAGSPNVLGAIALAAACATIREHRVADRGPRGPAHRSACVDGLRDIDGVTTYSIFGDDTERGPVVTFTVDGLDSSLVAAALSAEHGIGVRAGKFCAHLLVDALLDEGSDEHDTAVRVSAGLASRPEHVERLLAAVATLAADGPGAHYEHTAEQGWVAGRRPPRAVRAAALVTRRSGIPGSSGDPTGIRVRGSLSAGPASPRHDGAHTTP